MQLFDLEKFRGKKVVVALSGGADSVCLLDCFRRNSALFSITLSALHIEHGIRGENSLRDMRFCEALCEDWQIPLKVVRADIPSLAAAEKIGLEEAGRKFRYECFFSLIESGEADYVATAHHLNDLAETIFFRLARGTSLSGMRAVYAEREGIVRPLLSVSRMEILQYLTARGLPFSEDETNSDETFTRNYIRHSVLPAFEKISDGALKHLVKFASLASEDDAYLTRLAREQITDSSAERSVPVDLPEPLFSRACLICMDAEKDYTSANLEEIAKLRSLQSGKKVCLPKGQEAAREYDRIVFYLPAPPFHEHPFTDRDVLPEGKLRADLDRFPENCIVRTRREGDFFLPFGGKRKSLKKFLTDRKIPARTGAQIPLVACGSEILVIYGVEISERVKVTDETARIGFF